MFLQNPIKTDINIEFSQGFKPCKYITIQFLQGFLQMTL